MESSSFSFEFERQHKGKYYLELLDLKEYIGTTLPGYNIPSEDFLDICGDFAGPALEWLDELDRDDPKFESTRQALRDSVQGYLPNLT